MFSLSVCARARVAVDRTPGTGASASSFVSLSWIELILFTHMNTRLAREAMKSISVVGSRHHSTTHAIVSTRTIEGACDA